MVTTQTADNVLKSYYLPTVGEQLDKAANPFLAAIKRTASDVWGKDVRKTVTVGVNGGVGAGTEEGYLPEANGNRYVQLVSSLKNLYGTVAISDKAIRASANSDGAFVNLLNDEMEGLVKSASYHFGRMLFGDGSGKLATVTGAGSSDNEYTVDSARNLAVGMTVDVYASGGTLKEGGRVITAIGADGKTVSLSGAKIATPENCTLVLQNSKDLEITGLAAIFGDGDLYGVDRKSNPWMKPAVQTEVGALTEAKILKAMDDVEERSGGKTNFIVCSWGVRRALYNLLSDGKRAETCELEGGFRALSFNGIPVVADRFCPEGTMYLLNTDDFALHQLCDWQWLEGEDGKVLKQIAGKPVYTATLVKYAELLCYRPCGQAALAGITEA